MAPDPGRVCSPISRTYGREPVDSPILHRLQSTQLTLFIYYVICNIEFLIQDTQKSTTLEFIFTTLIHFSYRSHYGPGGTV